MPRLALPSLRAKKIGDSRSRVRTRKEPLTRRALVLRLKLKVVSGHCTVCNWQEGWGPECNLRRTRDSGDSAVEMGALLVSIPVTRAWKVECLRPDRGTSLVLRRRPWG